MDRSSGRIGVGDDACPPLPRRPPSSMAATAKNEGSQTARNFRLRAAGNWIRRDALNGLWEFCRWEEKNSNLHSLLRFVTREPGELRAHRGVTPSARLVNRRLPGLILHRAQHFKLFAQALADQSTEIVLRRAAENKRVGRLCVSVVELDLLLRRQIIGQPGLPALVLA